MHVFEYVINLDERGEFYADVRNEAFDTVWETHGEVFEDGFMRHKHDVAGLQSYLVSLGIMSKDDTLVKG